MLDFGRLSSKSVLSFMSTVDGQPLSKSVLLRLDIFKAKLEWICCILKVILNLDEMSDKDIKRMYCQTQDSK